MQSKNFFLNSKYFISFSAGRDHVGLFMIPSCIFDHKLPISPELQIDRLTFVFLKYRFSINLGKLKEVSTTFSLELNRDIIDQYIDWYNRNTHKEKLTYEKFEEFFNKNGYLEHFLANNNLNNHYVKNFLFKKIANV